MSSSLSFSKITKSLPQEWGDELLPQIQREVQASKSSIVVLDDDPLGTQTVHDVSILTSWNQSTLINELKKETLLFYLLTNSRSLKEKEAENLAYQIGQSLGQASKDASRDICVISRSDSTLRGHFPAEVNALARALDLTAAVQVLIPAFFSGGRYTIGDVHYLKEGDRLIPVAETPFARDNAFGYQSSNLKKWIEEKTGGTIKAETVKSISLNDIRDKGPIFVADQLLDCQDCEICVVNAFSPKDLEVVALALLQAEASGKKFLYRAAASVIPIRAGLPSRPLLTRAELRLPESGGGLIIVGSYVPKSTAQLDFLLQNSDIESIEIRVSHLLSSASRKSEITRVSDTINKVLKSNKDIVVYTSRKLQSEENATKSLEIIHQVSTGVVEIASAVSEKPRFVIAKGGITSSDLATEAFKVKRAQVLGQILPGVPVWQLDKTSTLPNLVYVVFPGNVGADDAVKKVYDQLK